MNKLAPPIRAFAPRLVIFDKDGTLIEFGSMWTDWARSLIETLCHACPELHASALATAIGYDLVTERIDPVGALAIATMARIRALLVAELGEQLQDPPRAELLLAAYWAVPDPRQAARPIADLVRLFRIVRASGAAIAVATTDDREPTIATLHALGLLSFVDVVVCGDDGIPIKPAPAMIERICQETGIAPEHAVIVGDTPADMRMGRAARVGLCIGVLSGVGTRQALVSDTDLVLDSVAQLCERESQ